MGYNKGKRSSEFASKTAHSHLINDSDVKEFLEGCILPIRDVDQSDISTRLQLVVEPKNQPIHNIIAIDGGYSVIPVKNEFPSSKICFLNFGNVYFQMDDLEKVSLKPFIDPDDLAKLKNIQRYKLTLPVSNIYGKDTNNFCDHFRKTLFTFYANPRYDGLADTLKWLVFEEYDRSNQKAWELSSCPCCGEKSIKFVPEDFKGNITKCKKCSKDIYITDLMRLHEGIFEDASGVLSYVVTATENIIFAHIIRLVLEKYPNRIKKILFIKDGPLAFFGLTANLHKPMRSLIKYLKENYGIYLCGVEKSGAFVEHANLIKDKIQNSSYLLLDNEYIYKNITPEKGDITSPFGKTTYFGFKIIYKSKSGDMYVITIPTDESSVKPIVKNEEELRVILSNIEKLSCKSYDNSLMPIVLVNKLVSLANHPSSKILERFAKETTT